MIYCKLARHNRVDKKKNPLLRYLLMRYIQTQFQPCVVATRLSDFTADFYPRLRCTRHLSLIIQTTAASSQTSLISLVSNYGQHLHSVEKKNNCLCFNSTWIKNNTWKVFTHHTSPCESNQET